MEAFKLLGRNRFQFRVFLLLQKAPRGFSQVVRMRQLPFLQKFNKADGSIQGRQMGVLAVVCGILSHNDIGRFSDLENLEFLVVEYDS
jgi:hypothetical protein